MKRIEDYTRQDFKVLVVKNEDFQEEKVNSVFFLLKDGDELFDGYYFDGYSNKDSEYEDVCASDIWYDHLHEEIIPSKFRGSTEVEYKFSGDFDECPQYLWDCGFRDIELHGIQFKG